jgi:hypothetical protein
METLHVPSCPQCHAAMRHVGSIPKLGSLPELLTFQCGNCSHVETIENKPSGWMRIDAIGWDAATREP